jgi:hypothetical protein
MNCSASVNLSPLPLLSSVLRSTSQMAITRPKRAALSESVPPLPPTPMQATVSSSLALALATGREPAATK